ncbi:site-specific integrase [Pelomonas aquatica]|jgi:integrase|uniref:Site-specific integrase n=1 Tax=Pelomonas aquatica TaxID=431058 RepID=A0A9X4LJL9_9BURK|nr:site-specific integrase [Pelomonas aquatica]
MASLRSRKENHQLFFDFRWNGARYRAQTDEVDSPAARKRLAPKLESLNEALRTGTFDLGKFFPDLAVPLTSTSPAATHEVLPPPSVVTPITSAVPCSLSFRSFSDQWYSEFRVGWRKTYDATVRGLLDQHLLPRFGTTAVSAVTRAQILEFRAHLSKLPGRREGSKLSPARINTIMLILRQILQEAADRYEFTMPMGRLKPLKIPKSDVMPFTLTQVQDLIARVRPDYKHYLTVRFFTGMRSGEIHGLKWKYIDFERRLILVRETIVGGEEDYTKTDASQRDIVMNSVVYDALLAQKKATGNRDYVFCNLKGEPVDTINFTKRVWYPLLRHLGLELRRPYQTRHTAATLWLAAGEMPEWIARQLGHASTEMLFRVYSRYVPNLTRNDGSAFDRMLQQTLSRDRPSAQDPQPPPSPWRLAA